ncbi:MAG: superoxide dismutase [Bacilli bacterium]|nr:superoxide dismutase [Bacilli bacterium]MDD4406421.1 superoxide dismutase [Bacilli bacterium]
MMEIITLPYKYNDFSFLSEETMKNHYEILYKGYVNNYNKAFLDLHRARVENDYTNIKALEKNLAFQGAGAVLHQLFFENISPINKSMCDCLINKINEDFGSLEDFKEQFINNITNIEGSGWGILGYSKILDKLIILQVEKHQDQTIWDFVPLLVIDIWEHAYYLDYTTMKKEYISDIFNYINWDIVKERYKKEV